MESDIPDLSGKVILVTGGEILITEIALSKAVSDTSPQEIQV